MQSELQLQAQCFQWLWNTYPETRLLCWHVTNEMKPMRLKTSIWAEGFDRGGIRDVEDKFVEESRQDFSRRIAQAKAAGLVPGVWDLHFLWKGTLYLFELKVGHNKLSKEQDAFESKVCDHGAVCMRPCYDLADFKERVMYIFQQ